MKNKKNTVLIEINDNKIRGIGVLWDYAGNPEIVTAAEIETTGLYMGRVVNVQEASSAIAELFSKISSKMQSDILGCHLILQSNKIQLHRNNAIVAFRDGEIEITHKQISRAKEIARMPMLSLDKEILNEWVDDYIIDGQTGIEHPYGLFAHKMELVLCILTLDRVDISNIRKIIELAGCGVESIMPISIADMYAFIGENEKKLNCIINISKNLYSIAVYSRNKLLKFNIYEVGYGDIIDSICEHNKCSENRALKFLSALNAVNNITTIKAHFPSVESKKINSIITACFTSLAKDIKEKLENQKFDNIFIKGEPANWECFLQFLKSMADPSLATPTPITIPKSQVLLPALDFASLLGGIQYLMTQTKKQKNHEENRGFFRGTVYKIKRLVEEYF